MEKFLREIDHFKILPRKRLIKGGKGNYKGTGFGHSLDFYGHREYAPGDDIRKMDWKAYMRTEKFYIKEFTEERQMHVNIILDCSASMNFGDPNKWEMAKTLSLGISYLVLKQMDYLSFYIVGNKMEPVQRNIRGKEYFYSLVEEISKIKPNGVTDLSNITNLNSLMSGMTFIISDCFCKEREKALDFLCACGQEVVLIQILSPSEINPAYEEELKLMDIETGDTRRIQLNHQIKEMYLEKVKNFINECKHMCSVRESRYILARTDLSPSKIMAQALGGF